jgi:aminoglycoside 3-N-acetyltransferase
MKKKIFDNIFKKTRKYINDGDTIFVHIDLTSFLFLQDFLETEKKFFYFFFKFFKKIIGKKGNLIVPAFSYSWGYKKKNLFDTKNSKSKLGFFSEFIRKNNLLKRSKDPIFSYYVYGLNSKYLLKMDNKDSFGKNSIYYKLNILDGKIVMWGIKKFDPTYVHYIEQFYNDNINKYPFRFKKKILVKINKKNTDFNFFLRPLKSNMIYDEKKIIKILNDKKLLKKFTINNATIQIINSKILFTEGIRSLKKNIKTFVKHV